MIHESEVPEILCSKIPDIAFDLLNNGGQDIFKTIRLFTDYTNDHLREGNTGEVCICFSVANELLVNGDKNVKRAIENMFIYSAAQIIEFRHLSDELKALFRATFGREYHRLIATNYP